jgi:hypothetical protein
MGNPLLETACVTKGKDSDYVRWAACKCRLFVALKRDSQAGQLVKIVRSLSALSFDSLGDGCNPFDRRRFPTGFLTSDQREKDVSRISDR